MGNIYKGKSVKCPLCGENFILENEELTVKCPKCGESISSVQAMKYYNSLNDNVEEKTEAHGENYHKLNMLLDEIKSLIDFERYDEAFEKANDALKLSDTDYRVFMSFVAIKTKNYTDLKDESHKEYINKAIAVADEDGKKDITKTYRAYYNKRKFTDEEMQAFEGEKKKALKGGVEKKLKSLIPDYMVKEKRKKIFLILFPILFVIGFSLVVVSFFIDFEYTVLISLPFVCGGYALFRFWFNYRDELKIFNALLDLYDLLDGLKLDEKTSIKIYTVMDKLSNKFLNKDAIVTFSDDTEAIVTLLIDLGDKRVDEFLINNGYFNQFIEMEN